MFVYFQYFSVVCLEEYIYMIVSVCKLAIAVYLLI